MFNTHAKYFGFTPKLNQTFGDFMYKNNGFTLIELLIALTILGILTTMALPVYFGHQARAQLTESITLGGAHRVNVENYILKNGNFPPNDMTLSLIPWVEEIDGELVQRYQSVESVELVPNEQQPGAGEILISLGNREGIATPLRSQNIIFERSANGTWFCRSSVEESLLPRSCNPIEE